MRERDQRQAISESVERDRSAALFGLPTHLGEHRRESALCSEDAHGYLPAIHKLLHAVSIEIGVLSVFQEQTLIHGTDTNFSATCSHMLVDKFRNVMKTFGPLKDLYIVLLETDALRACC